MRTLYRGTETHIAAEVDDASHKAAPVFETFLQFPDAQPSMFTFFGIGDLALIHPQGPYLFLSIREEAGLSNAVWEHEEGNNGHEEGG